MRVPPAIQLDLLTPDLPGQIASLPRTAGIYVLETPERSPHFSWSGNLRSRLHRLLLSGKGRQNDLLTRLRQNLASVQYWPTASKLESALLMYTLVKAHFPADYVSRLRLRMPWFLILTTEEIFPRLALTNRLSTKSATAFGPFLTRDAAQAYEQSVLGLFQIRRCVETFVPAPEHPGCIYGEMNQCSRPCQAALTSQEYASEAARVSEFLITNGKSMAGALLAARDRAAHATEFEQAAYLHKRLEKVKEAIQNRDPVIRDVSQFHGVALTRGPIPRTFRLWPMVEGYWNEALTLDFSSGQFGSRSLDLELRARLNDALRLAARHGSRMEQLAIFSRWYYSSWRDGHWFPFSTLADLNYRKLVREISTMAKQDSEPNLQGQAC